jgi:hypothetical protein
MGEQKLTDDRKVSSKAYSSGGIEMRTLRKAIKRIGAFATGLTFVGATMLGASAAADLSQYPSPLFIKDGKFNGLIVVGDDAAASDVVGSIDVATALQAESVGTDVGSRAGQGLYTPGAIPGVTLTGDVAEFGQPNDLLELEEPLGDVKETFTERDLLALKGGIITTDEGTTDYNQYLRFDEGSGSDAFRSNLTVVYDEDEDDNVGDFLFAGDRRNTFMFEYELEFEEGAESEIVSMTELEDLEDEILNILGTPFAIADTSFLTTTNVLNLELLGGAVSDIMEEGETKTYTIGGKEYEVNILIVSDALEVVKFKMNGEITDELRDGETDILKDGTRIGIREILPNEAEEVTGGDLVEFYLGATEVEFEDQVNNTNFSQGVEVNDETIEDGLVSIRGVTNTALTKFEILTIKYRLEADTLLGDLFVPPGHGVREFLDEPEGMLSPNWDIVYGGLMDTGVSILKFDAAGDDEYDLKFTTQEGLNYNIEFLDNDEASGLRVGDDDDDLLWIEGNDTRDFYIDEDDEFILTDDNDETGFTHVVAFESFEGVDNQVTLTDLYGETREFTAENIGTELIADLIFGGNTFRAYVNFSGAGENLSVDLNNDGIIGDGGVGLPFTNDACTASIGSGGSSNIIGLSINATGGHINESNQTAKGTPTDGSIGPCRAAIVIQGGGVLDLGVCDGRTPPGHSACNTTNTGGFFASTGFPGTDGDVMRVGLTTLNSEFDEDGPRDNGGNERIYIDFQTRANAEIGLDVAESDSRFPLDLNEIKENDDIERDMSDYGVLVELYDPEGSSEAEDLTIEYPLLQRGAHVFIVAGQYGIEKHAGGLVSQRVQRINVGAAKLASEVADITAVDAVVVGGPCANSAAAALMGNPDDCAAGFEPGKAMLKLFENGDNVAVLVAGYDAIDTRRASRVLANHADYDLSGTEVVVTGTSLTDISVSVV